EARIKACLRRRRETSAPEEEVLDLGSLKVFCEQRTVVIGRRRERLTRKEFALLKLFIENKGKVLSREFISSRLWNEKEVYPWSRALDVHIRRLRKKIEPDPANPRFIVTHSGVGYRFNVE
ncbi:MAG: DNA-binding response regulator, partial [Thermodesulfatator sp.]